MLFRIRKMDEMQGAVAPKLWQSQKLWQLLPIAAARHLADSN
jgi:hypothetical protein